MRKMASAFLARRMVMLVVAVATMVAHAQGYKDLHDFNCKTEGCNLQYAAVLAQGRDGNLYGTMLWGGTFNFGTFFSATPDGLVAVPYTDGNFYGTTYAGGAGGVNFPGTIFRISAAGTIKFLYSFSGASGTSCPSPPTPKPDGGNPFAPALQGKDGNFYGATSRGTGYKITASGKFTALCSLPTLVPSGNKSPVVQGTDGNFYGTSTSGNGTVFKFSTSGATKTVHGFDSMDGSAPIGPVVQASDGNFYGTTATGGPLGSASGEVFKLTAAGTLTFGGVKATTFTVNSASQSYGDSAHGSHYRQDCSYDPRWDCYQCDSLHRHTVMLGDFSALTDGRNDGPSTAVQQRDNW
jgi:uncharacterized repeat protein (TIGR03803 family)